MPRSSIHLVLPRAARALSRRLAPWAALFMSACVFNTPPLADGAAVTCASGADCPSDRVCVLERCVPRDAPCLDVDARDARPQPDGNACGDGRICVAALCVAPRCGDGVVTGDEVCDDGAANSDVTSNACRSTCVPARCGDGVIDTGEVCDGAPACRADCGKIEVCGDRDVDTQEACDDGNDNPRDGCDACALQSWQTRLVVSGRVEGSAPQDISLSLPSGVHVDALGRVWVLDGAGARVRRIEQDGTILTVAGNGSRGFSGDGGPAVAASLDQPESVAVDAFGRAWVADAGNHAIRRIEQDGTLRTVAGIGIEGPFTPDGALAQGNAVTPSSVTLDPLDRIVFIDGLRVRRIESSGALSTLAGSGSDTFSGDGGPPRLAGMAPQDVAYDAAGRLVILDGACACVRRVSLDGTVITRIAGGGASGAGADDVPALNAELLQPLALALDRSDRMLIGDNGTGTVHRVDDDGVMRRVAGTGSFAFDVEVTHALEASFYSVSALAVDAEDRVWLVDTIAQRVVRFDNDGAIEAVVGSAAFRFVNDGAEATSASLQTPMGLAVEPSGSVLVADSLHSRLLRVRADGLIERAHGTGELIFGARTFPTDLETLAYAEGVAVDEEGRIFIADTVYNRVLRIELDGAVTWLAGTGASGFSGDGGPAIDAELSGPSDVAVADDGAVWVADRGNSRVRRIDVDGTLTTEVGSGAQDYAGDGGLPLEAGINPVALVFDAQGALVIADSANHRVRYLDLGGIISTIAGTGVEGSGGDDGPAVAAQLAYPTGVAVDGFGRVLIADSGNRSVRRFGRGGTIETVAGTGVEEGVVEGALALGASMSVADVAVLADGTLVVSEGYGPRVRRVSVGGRVTTMAGALHPYGPAPFTRAQLYAPRALLAVEGLGIFSVGGFGRLMQLDLEDERVRVVLGVETAAPDVRARAATAELLEEPGGIAWRAVEGELIVSERASGNLRAVKVGGSTTLLPPGEWTVRVIPTDAAAPAGLAWDAETDTLVVADAEDHCVRRLGLTGATVEVLAGTCGVQGNQPGFLSAPTHVARSPVSAAIYVADTGNERVLRVDDGAVALVVGDGTRSSAGEGAPARVFPVDRPGQLAVDAHGNLFVSSSSTVRLVANVDGDVDADGDDLVRTLYGAGPRTAYPESQANCLGALTLEGDDVHVADSCVGFSVSITPSR